MVPSLLILTDFFQAANHALDYATNLAQPLGARLVLLHVRRDSILDPDMFTGEITNLNKQAIDLTLNRVAHNLPVPVVAEVGHGRVAFAVADAVSRHHPALVVLGRPDYSALPDELVDTTAHDLLSNVPHPLLVVPYNVVARSAPRRFLLAVDGEPFTLGEFAGAARHLLTALGAEVTVLHVVAEAEVPNAQALDTVERTGLLADLAPAHTRIVVNADPAAAIVAAAHPDDFDAVVVVARSRSVLGRLFHHSVTAQVVLHSALPVLVLPAQ